VLNKKHAVRRLPVHPKNKVAATTKISGFNPIYISIGNAIGQ
jgi:hypothetical protein